MLNADGKNSPIVLAYSSAVFCGLRVRIGAIDEADLITSCDVGNGFFLKTLSFGISGKYPNNSAFFSSLVFYYVWAAFIQESIEHNPNIDYPILTSGHHIRMVEALQNLSDKRLNITMTVQEPDAKGFGMLGSGLFIINPPWTLNATMQSVMPYVVEKLAQYPGASYEIKDIY